MKRRIIHPANRRRSLGVWLVLLHLPLTCVSYAQADQAPLTDAEFERLHRELRPADDELWRTVPWNISLLDGQRLAAESNKPLFIWAMDGHPLGCT